ncbi:MAG TPA: hypothetical protein HPP80_00275 [Rhodospirillaceae bacterium]|nr:hypothetical protein [Rhodospirillaceae bacterium]
MASPSKSSSGTGAKTPDPEAAARHEVTRMLKGPVAERFKSLIPPLAESPDPYKTIMDSVDLLDACFKLFRSRRDAFADLLQDSEGKLVEDDDKRLNCGRSVNEVIGMCVRTSMRNFAEAHFGDPISPAKSKTPVKAKQPQSGKSRFKLLNVALLAGLFHRNYGKDKPAPVGMTNSGRFYAAIKDALDFEWQVRFFPIYVQIPAHVFQKLGIGITRMDTEERLQRLAQLAANDISKAESVIKDPAMMQEMIDNNVLASATVGQLGEAGFSNIHGALGHLDAKKKWDIMANKETAMRLHEDKRITQQDIVALSEYLDRLNEFALDAIFDLRLNRDQMAMFLKTAEENLGPKLFMALFGPIQTIVPEDHDEQQKLRRYQNFTQNSLRGLVTAVKQLEDNLRKTGGETGIAECLGTVCRARRIDLEAEIKKLAPASLGA